MIENSTAGLTLLEPEHKVVVTGEERHQAALARYAPRADGRARRVAVELRVTSAPDGSHRRVEVLLDGHRVGELTPRMAQRYTPPLDDLLRRGGRPGCVAFVRNTGRGLEIDLRLPREAAVGAPEPDGTRGPSGRRRTPLLIGALVCAALLIIGMNARGGDTASSTSTAAQTTAEPVAVPPTSEASQPESRSPAPQPRPAPQPQPTSKPRITTEEAPIQQPRQQGCDPNYSGGCVPIAEDVDCAGGSGNGPAYVRGPVQVVGNDIYQLDSNNDGEGCES